MSKVDLEIAENLEFEDGDIAITIKQDGSIGKVILPKMDLKILMAKKEMLFFISYLYVYLYYLSLNVKACFLIVLAMTYV